MLPFNFSNEKIIIDVMYIIIDTAWQIQNAIKVLNNVFEGIPTGFIFFI